jgi:hypothetical protein
MGVLALTVWAEVTRTLPNYYFADFAATAVAGFSFAAIDEQALFEVTGPTVSANKIPKGGATLLNCAEQYTAYGSG